MRRFQPGEGPSRGLLGDCETDASFYSTSEHGIGDKHEPAEILLTLKRGV